MPLDLVLRQGRLAGGEHGLVDIGVAGGRIVEIAPSSPPTHRRKSSTAGW
jgi:dihydroorotase-like cyclic amidohydrolase